MTYEEARAQLAMDYGWTFADIDEMSWEQIGSACRQGKSTKVVPVESDEQVRDFAKNWRQYYGV